MKRSNSMSILESFIAHDQNQDKSWDNVLNNENSFLNYTP